MDFQMSGAAGIVQFLIQTIPFLNARGQGLYKMGRAAAENPLAFLAKGALIMLASLGLWAIFRDDDRYKEGIKSLRIGRSLLTTTSGLVTITLGYRSRLRPALYFLPR
jgi:hypothetical protein